MNYSQKKSFPIQSSQLCAGKEPGVYPLLLIIKFASAVFVYLFACAIAKILTFNMFAAYVKIPDESNGYEECVSGQKHSWGAWCGSQEGLFYLHW